MAVSQKSHLPALLWLLRTYGESKAKQVSAIFEKQPFGELERTYLLCFGCYALTENQFSNFCKHRRGRACQAFLQFFPALILGQLRKPIARKLQELRHFLVDICSVRRGGQFFASQQLGNIGLRNFGGAR